MSSRFGQLGSGILCKEMIAISFYSPFWHFQNDIIHFQNDIIAPTPAAGMSLTWERRDCAMQLLKTANSV
jgi:hypothetical protein